jgi:hypothetical protein
MRRAWVSVVVVALGCGGATESPPQDPTPPSGTSAPTPTRPPAGEGPTTPGAPTASPPPQGTDPNRAACGSWGGKIKGDSTCWTMDRATAAVAPSKYRASMPMHSLRCGDSVTLATMTVRLDCVETSTGADKQATVSLVVTEDQSHPALAGKSIFLDERKGFYDFINTWVGDRTSLTEITIDYGILD